MNLHLIVQMLTFIQISYWWHIIHHVTASRNDKAYVTMNRDKLIDNNIR